MPKVKSSCKPYFRMFGPSGKNTMKRIFKLGFRYQMSDEEYIDRANFIIGAMLYEGFEVKCMLKDFIPFDRFYKPNWVELYDNHKQNPLLIKTVNPLFPNDTPELMEERNTKMNAFYQEYMDKLEAASEAQSSQV